MRWRRADTPLRAKPKQEWRAQAYLHAGQRDKSKHAVMKRIGDVAWVTAKVRVPRTGKAPLVISSDLQRRSKALAYFHSSPSEAQRPESVFTLAPGKADDPCVASSGTGPHIFWHAYREKETTFESKRTSTKEWSRTVHSFITDRPTSGKKEVLRVSFHARAKSPIMSFLRTMSRMANVQESIGSFHAKAERPVPALFEEMRHPV